MEHQVETTPVEMEATDGAKITVCVPTLGDEPTARGKAGYESVLNRENWKDRTRRFITEDFEEAQEVARAMDWYLGGHEMEEFKAIWIVQSAGYYYYVGI